MFAQRNPFARIYRHAYEVLSNHKSFNINSEKRSNSSGSTESESPYIVINSSMRMRLVEGGDRRTQNLPTTEEVAAVIPIEYIDRSFREIVLTLRSSSRNDSLRHERDFEQRFQCISQGHAAYMPAHYMLLLPHGTHGRH
ncbi:hypothetical protein RMATCC62417_11684 [Rhizopus microsporus]|nr:hypothetical protein RMATCC62417_11684 [Rhizopus microsporus]